MTPSGPDTPRDQRVIGSAVEELVENGVDGFTTPSVALRAGVSQGTVFRYFPTKRALLAATAAEAIRAATADHAAKLFVRLERDAPTSDADLVRVAIEALWGGYSDERVAAAYEVRARCRTDEALRDELVPMLRAMDVDGGDVFALLMPESFRFSAAEIRQISRLVTSALQGRAFTRSSLPDDETDREVVDTLIDAVLARVPANAAPPVRREPARTKGPDR